ncbi:MAG: hypothetical protein O2780_17275 [Proteobacteria bacterium]|nr:hypothetical protein [Pseudomonadota bacterium]MDA1299353.1 hypothetical protein [Pseudomonadota bacterium]
MTSSSLVPNEPVAVPSLRRRIFIATAVVMAVILVAAAFNEFVKPRIFPKRFGVVIEDSLYRSGRIHPDLLKSVLEKHRIDTIVTLTVEVEGHEFQTAERAIADELGIEIARFPLAGDGTGDMVSYIGAIKKIDAELDQGRRVLVHCAAGTQRTGGVLFLYETLIGEVAPATAFAEMQRYDFDPVDNPRLLPYLEQILPGVTRGLAREGIVITSTPPVISELTDDAAHDLAM